MNADRWQQIKQIYSDLLELDPAGRKAFLDEACADDEALRAEVERLLASRAEAEDLLERPAIVVAAEVLAREQALAAPDNLVGRTISHFRIVEEIGAGGMGVVCRAWDERLERDTAVKFLPEVFATDTERLARLEREAKILASVSHPNVAAIFGLEVDGDRRFLVMEYVEGETLAVKLARGPLALEEALEICRQIAEGVEAAHEKGVIHRDLKPANVKITPDGQVKVLDFGLARGLSGEMSPTDGSPSPATPGARTHPGMILGTAAYMSPEQAKGRRLDRRTDVWAFGCILYECLTGKRAFTGDSAAETLAAILTGEPDWSALPVDARARIQPVLERCLQKDLKLRYRDIADASLALEGNLVAPSGPNAAHRRLSTAWLAAAAVAILVAGAVAGVVLTRYASPGSALPVVRSTIKVEPGRWLDGMRREMDRERPSRTAMAISSDAAFIVYSAIEESPGPQAKPRLYMRRMDQTGAKPITGTAGGINPFLSPDNRWVGFWADRKLMKVPLEGGVPFQLCEAAEIFGASWGPDNTIVFAAGGTSGLSSVSADGGKPEALTTPDPKREEASHRLPSWLPDGKTVLFTVMRHGWDTQPRLALLRLDTREWHVLLQDASHASYVSTGHLVFLRQGTLMAARFDPARSEVVGQPAPLVEDVMQAFATSLQFNTGAGQFAVADSGALVYAAGGVLPDKQHSLVWVDQQGTEQPATPLQKPFFAPRLSPDGQRIAYATMGREWRVWVYDLSTGANSQLITQGWAEYPIWTPDGKRILFAGRHGALNLFSQPSDGSLPIERHTTSQHEQVPGSWSSLPSGQTLALVEDRVDGGAKILLMDARSGRVRPLLDSPFSEWFPEFSPDGRWLAYTSDESGRGEVYVRPFPGPGMKHQVSNEGGFQPLWARDGKQLFYRMNDQVWAADVRTDGGFATSKPHLLFERAGYGRGSPVRNYDLSMDGQRFLMVKLEQTRPTPVTEMVLVQNWFEELKRLVPARK